MDKPINKYKLNFQYQAILDAQSAIRAIDTKIGILLIVILIPLSNLSSIRFHISNICPPIGVNLQFFMFTIIAFVFFLVWILAFFSAIRAIIAIDNPSSHILGCESLKGAFYCPGLYRLGFWDFILNRKTLMAQKNLLDVYKSIPTSIEDISMELTFEQMKLAYIRDVKFLRQKWAFVFSISWLIFGFVFFLLSIIE